MARKREALDVHELRPRRRKARPFARRLATKKAQRSRHQVKSMSRIERDAVEGGDRKRPADPFCALLLSDEPRRGRDDGPRYPIAHGNRGDLAIGIVAPSGMVSVADPRKADEGENFENFTFTSVRHWGENSNGVWRVRVLDTEKNGVDGALLKVTLRFYGTAR